MQNYWNLYLACKQNSFTGPLIIGTFEKRAPGPLYRVFRKFVPIVNCILSKAFTAVTTNTRPQRVFCSVQTCVLVDVNQPLPRFFTRWPREDSFSVSWALGRICRRFSRVFATFCCSIWHRFMSRLRGERICWVFLGGNSNYRHIYTL